MMHDNDKNGVRKGSIFVSTSGVLGEGGSERWFGKVVREGGSGMADRDKEKRLCGSTTVSVVI